MNVIVNATSIYSSGTLTVLRQFLSNIERYSARNRYYVFVSPIPHFVSYENVTYIPIITSRRMGRIFWDERGFKKQVKKIGVNPDVIVSFQNTGVKYDKSIPQIWYFQQALCVESYKWNLFTNTSLFYYRNILSFFIRKHLRKNTYIVTQIPSVREKFIKRFNVNPDNVSVITPDMDFVKNIKVIDIKMDEKFIHFIYPATYYPYKNHIDIVNCLSVLRATSFPSIESLRVHLTLDEKEAESLVQIMEEKGVRDNFVFDGKMPYETLLSMYKESNGLLFPSYIESFGLPLIEAAYYGCPIIVSDMPYAHDVLAGYEGANYVKLHDMDSWCDAITKISGSKIRYGKYDAEKSNWKSFFELIEACSNNV